MKKIHKRRCYKKWLIENRKDTLDRQRTIYEQSKNKQ